MRHPFVSDTKDKYQTEADFQTLCTDPGVKVHPSPQNNFIGDLVGARIAQLVKSRIIVMV